MLVPWSWLKDYIDLTGVSVDELAERWTLAGLEVSGVTRIGDWWDREHLLVGAVTRVEPHPAADRLVLALVDFGADAPHRCVTGAPNLLPLRNVGDLDRPLKVAFAREGVELFDGHKDGWVKTRLKGRPVRGVMSDAMVCSEKELGLSEDHSGILVLDDDAPVGTPLVDVLGDAVFDIDITANLARAMSMVGIARETGAILHRPFAAPEPKVRGAAADLGEHVAVTIEDPELCPRYTVRVIRDVRIGPSPWWMARRLTLAGMRPINNVVDITNYAMLEWGEPLHAFDYDRLVARAGGSKPKIVVRRARSGERMTTLDEVERELDERTLLICDTAGPVAIGGVMGGADAEVGPDTTNILLEAAAFDNINVRRTSKAQKLPSESAMRFGRGVHPALTVPGGARAAGLMAELCGGTALAGMVDAYPRPTEPVVVRFDPAEIERVLGFTIPVGEAIEILERLEFDVASGSDGAYAVSVPPHRMDVEVPADLLEEIARIHGYDKMPATLMSDPLPPQRESPRLRLEERVRDELVAGGLQEIVSYRLVSVEHESGVMADGRVEPGGYVVLANPISPERSAMRRSILTGLLDAVAGNRRFTDRVAVFEVGPVFHATGAGLPAEPRRIGIALTGPAASRSWRNADVRAFDFYDAKGAVEALVGALGIDVAWSNGQHPSMHPARTAQVMSGVTVVGHVGELHPLVREHWDLGDAVVAVADIDLDAVQGLIGGQTVFAPYSAYPAVARDLCVIVADDVPADAVADVMRKTGGGLLADVTLFDVYQGSQIGAGRKSLAWSLTFQAPDRTLAGDVVDGQRDRIARALAKELGAQIR